MAFNTQSYMRNALLLAFLWTTLFTQQSSKLTSADLILSESKSAFSISSTYKDKEAYQPRTTTTARLMHSTKDEIESL